MIRPIPSGTRDVLPDEMRELRAITEPMRAAFERFGYGEVYTPALEYGSTLDAAGLEGYWVGMGDAGLYPALLDSLGVPGAARAELMQALARRDFVALEHRIDSLGLDADAAALLVEVPQRRGGKDLLSAPD